MACVKTDKRKERKKRSLGKVTNPARINVRTAKTPLIFHNIKLPLVSEGLKVVFY